MIRPTAARLDYGPRTLSYDRPRVAKGTRIARRQRDTSSTSSTSRLWESLWIVATGALLFCSLGYVATIVARTALDLLQHLGRYNVQELTHMIGGF